MTKKVRYQIVTTLDMERDAFLEGIGLDFLGVYSHY